MDEQEVVRLDQKRYYKMDFYRVNPKETTLQVIQARLIEQK